MRYMRKEFDLSNMESLFIIGFIDYLVEVYELASTFIEWQWQLSQWEKVICDDEEARGAIDWWRMGNGVLVTSYFVSRSMLSPPRTASSVEGLPWTMMLYSAAIPSTPLPLVYIQGNWNHASSSCTLWYCVWTRLNGKHHCWCWTLTHTRLLCLNNAYTCDLNESISITAYEPFRIPSPQDCLLRTTSRSWCRGSTEMNIFELRLIYF